MRSCDPASTPGRRNERFESASRSWSGNRLAADAHDTGNPREGLDIRHRDDAADDAIAIESGLEPRGAHGFDVTRVLDVDGDPAI
jgi:hypothetical protein